MISIIVKLDGRKMIESFHEYFAETFGFPDFYGKNMDAWIDCMSDLDCEEAGMISKNYVAPGQSVVFYIKHQEELKQYREIWDDFIECTSHLNKDRLQRNQPPLIYLAF